MNKWKLLFSVAIFHAVTAAVFSQNIVVNDTYTAQQLVQNVLLNSPCANASNFSVSGDTFSGNNSYGYFSYSGNVFPFATGIVLSTSRAYRTQGPNSDLIDEGSTAWQGDADLEQALGITGTVNATVLEFDFTPLTDKISFDYLFASEEYHGNAFCRYSDGFAFLLKPAGSTGPYQNLALVPNTNVPVKVTSVHPGFSGTNGCNPENANYFGGFNPTNYPINFNGQTKVMTARANVTPGLVYHIKLVIADEQNIRYDSAIFLDGGSFNVGVDLGPDRLLATNNPLCFGENLTLDATLPGTNTYRWFKNNGATPVATTPIYTVQDAGIYRVEVVINSSACTTTSEIEIEYAALPLLQNQTLAQCDPDNDGMTAFNLTQLDALITAANPQLGAVTYYRTLANAQGLTNPITNPTTFQSASGNQVYASTANTFGCYNQATVNLVISNNSVATPNPISKCDADGQPDGYTTFNFNTEVSPTVTAGLPAGLSVSYFATANDAVLQSNALPNNFTNTSPLQQTVYALFLNGPDCYGIVPVVLQVMVFNPPQLQDETRPICNTTPINLTVPNNYASYLWSTGVTSNSISVNQPGSYTVTVTDGFGCQKTKTFTVTASQTAIINTVTVNDFNGSQNSVEVQFSGIGNYEFSMDGIQYQSSPVFTDVPPGVYFVYVKNACGIASKKITVLDYPRFFTPNGDGINDTWQLKNIQSIPNTKISVFDRYGKLLYQFNEKQQGWNGRSNQNEMPATDYWFVIEFQNRDTVKGHFSLKR